MQTVSEGPRLHGGACNCRDDGRNPEILFRVYPVSQDMYISGVCI